MIFDKVTRGEKLSAIKLAVVQYGVLGLMLALSAGLWRLQVLGAQNFRTLAEQNRIRKVPILAPRGKLFDRENRLVVDNYPSVSCFLVREQNHNVDADLPPIVYPAAIVADHDTPAARKLLDLLRAPSSQAIFARDGFDAPPKK